MKRDGHRIIEMKNVSFKYDGQEKYVIKDFNLEVDEKELILLVGRSGSGKTTIARIITGLIPHFYRGDLKGDVLINGRNIREMPIYEIGSYIGLVRQNPENQILMTTVEREIAFSLEFTELPFREIRKRVEESIKKMNIEHLRNRDMDTLSGGELQKVAIASILVKKPKVIIMDEPSAYLSPRSVNELRRYIHELYGDGVTFIIIDHRLDYWLEIAERVVAIDGGRKVFDGNIERFTQFLEKNDLGLNIPLYLRLVRDINMRCGRHLLTPRSKPNEILSQLHEMIQR